MVILYLFSRHKYIKVWKRSHFIYNIFGEIFFILIKYVVECKINVLDYTYLPNTQQSSLEPGSTHKKKTYFMEH